MFYSQLCWHIAIGDLWGHSAPLFWWSIVLNGNVKRSRWAKWSIINHTYDIMASLQINIVTYFQFLHHTENTNLIITNQTILTLANNIELTAIFLGQGVPKYLWKIYWNTGYFNGLFYHFHCNHNILTITVIWSENAKMYINTYISSGILCFNTFKPQITHFTTL